jgi:hypothetical protein
MVTPDHTVRTQTRAPAKHFVLLHHRRSYWTASGHSGLS